MRNYEDKQNAASASDVWDNEHLNGLEATSFLKELKNAVISAGLTPATYNNSPAVETFYQLAQAMAIYGMGGAEYHKDTGTGGAYVLDPVSNIRSPDAYFEGMTVSFVAGNGSLANATVNINAIGANTIKDTAGTNLIVNSILAGEFVKLRYDGTNFVLTDENIVDLSRDGYQKLNSGIIVQWGRESGSGTGATTFNYPITFPNDIFILVGSVSAITSGSTGGQNFSFIPNSTTQGQINTVSLTTITTWGVHWIAVGY